MALLMLRDEGACLMLAPYFFRSQSFRVLGLQPHRIYVSRYLIGSEFSQQSAEQLLCFQVKNRPGRHPAV